MKDCFAEADGSESFEIRRSAVHGFGVFCRVDVPALSIVSDYCGLKKQPDGVFSAAANGRQMIRKLAYLQTSWDGMSVIDPTDDDGAILDEFSLCKGLYVNEPPPGQQVNACFALHHGLQRVEVRLLRKVKADEEVFVFYGAGYPRDYLISKQCTGFASVALQIESNGDCDLLLVGEKKIALTDLGWCASSNESLLCKAIPYLSM